MLVVLGCCHWWSERSLRSPPETTRHALLNEKLPRPSTRQVLPKKDLTKMSRSGVSHIIFFNQHFYVNDLSGLMSIGVGQPGTRSIVNYTESRRLVGVGTFGNCDDAGCCCCGTSWYAWEHSHGGWHEPSSMVVHGSIGCLTLLAWRDDLSTRSHHLRLTLTNWPFAPVF